MARRRTSKGVWLWPVVSILLLAGIVAEAQRRIIPTDANPHQARCAAAIDGIPMVIMSVLPGSGEASSLSAADAPQWHGEDVAIPPEASKLLRDNKILSRRYTKYQNNARMADGQWALLLVVHCVDARDLQGHYPKICYPAQGQSLIREEARSMAIDGTNLKFVEYRFAPEPNAKISEEEIVYNFFITPRVPGITVSHPELNGAICADMNSVYTSGEDYQRRYFGATEFQLLMPAHMNPGERDQAFRDLLTPNMNVIKVLENLSE